MVTLLTSEVRTLRKANDALSKRRRAKKTRLQLGGALTVGDTQDLLTQKDVKEQLEEEMSQVSGRKKSAQPTQRHCSNCGEAGHNARTCQKVEELSDVYSSK